MMRSVAQVVSAVLATATAVACGGSGGNLETFTDSASYALGMSVALSVERASADVSIPALVQGLEDGLADGATAVTEEEAGNLVQRLAEASRQAQQAAMAEQAESNAEQGRAFLEENGQREGVVTTASGLQYEVVRQGDGPRPEPTDVVQVHYTGTLIDGTEFDATDRSGTPATFRLNAVIPGWTEGVGLMAVGSVYRLYISGDLGYGMRGSPPDIGPNATLIFDVELVGIQ